MVRRYKNIRVSYEFWEFLRSQKQQAAKVVGSEPSTVALMDRNRMLLTDLMRERKRTGKPPRDPFEEIFPL